LAWKEDFGKHTSSYIDDKEWKDSISSAGMKQMNSLVSGIWNEERWEELLEKSEIFVEESGLLKDSLRSELLNDVQEIINQSKSNFKPLLCLLGKSIVIVPKDIKNKNSDLDSFAELLEKAGFNAIRTKVGELF